MTDFDDVTGRGFGDRLASAASALAIQAPKRIGAAIHVGRCRGCGALTFHSIWRDEADAHREHDVCHKCGHHVTTQY